MNAAVTALNRAAMTTKWLRRVANQNHQKTLAMNPLIRQQQKKAAMPIVAVRQTPAMIIIELYSAIF
jgi:hypothetical protein